MPGRGEEINPFGTNMKIPRDFKDWAGLNSADDAKGKALLPSGVEISELDTDQFVLSMLRAADAGPDELRDLEKLIARARAEKQREKGD